VAAYHFRSNWLTIQIEQITDNVTLPSIIDEWLDGWTEVAQIGNVAEKRSSLAQFIRPAKENPVGRPKGTGTYTYEQMVFNVHQVEELKRRGKYKTLKEAAARIYETDPENGYQMYRRHKKKTPGVIDG
jgi:hypothetical protein